MMKFDMHITTHIQSNRPDLIQRTSWDAADFGAGLIARLARQKAPVKTGALRDSIKKERTERGFQIGPGTDYDIYVEFGTQAHWIFPRNARVLHWIGSDGKHYFSKGHRVSGARAQPYMRPALDEARSSISRYLQTVIRRALK